MHAAPDAAALADLASQFDMMVGKKPVKAPVSFKKKIQSVDLNDVRTFTVGAEAEGIVERVSQGGAVVRFSPQVAGYLHVSEIQHAYLASARDALQEGEKIKLRVIKNDPDFLGLSKKKVGAKRKEDFSVGDKVTGKVLKVTAVGAVVDIGAEVACFLHKSQMNTGTFVNDAREFLSVGDDVTAWVRGIQEQRIEITKKTGGKPKPSLRINKMSVGDQLTGKVDRITDSAVYVDVGADDKGVIWLRNINDGIIASANEVLETGEQIDVRVAKVSNGRLELRLVTSVLERLPPVDAFEDYPKEEWVDGFVTHIRPIGAFISLKEPGSDNRVTGILFKKFMAPKQRIFLMDEIKVRVLYADKPKRRLVLGTFDPADIVKKQSTNEFER